MKKLFVSLLILILSILTISFSGNESTSKVKLWQKILGGKYNDEAYSIQKTSDGGYIVAGNTNSFGYFDVYVLKLDVNGNLEWQKTFGGSIDDYDKDYAYYIQKTTDGGYVIVGWTLPYGVEKSEIYILKLNANGNLVWQKTFGGEGWDEGFSIQQSNDGGYIIAGGTSSFGKGGEDVYILKLDANGNLIWQKTFGGNKQDRVYSIEHTRDGGYIVAGETSSFGAGGKDVYILKFDTNGNLIWQKTFGGEGWDEAYSIQQTSDGGYIVAGYTDSFGAGESDVYILKLGEKGNLVWEKTFGGHSSDRAYSIQQTSDGGYIVAGETQSFGAGFSDVYILKLNKDGNLVWQKTYGGSAHDMAYSIQQTNDGGYIIAGWTESFGAGNRDVYILKIDENGNTGPYPTK